jgi:hypothetical protein
LPLEVATLDAAPSPLLMGCLSTSLGWVRQNRLIASGVLGGNAMQRLECVPEKVTMLSLVRAPCVVVKLHARAP